MAPGKGRNTQSTAKVTIPSLIPNPEKKSGHNGGGPARGNTKDASRRPDGEHLME